MGGGARFFVQRAERDVGRDAKRNSVGGGGRRGARGGGRQAGSSLLGTNHQPLYQEIRFFNRYFNFGNSSFSANMMRLAILLAALPAVLADDNGKALTPPMGWRRCVSESG